MPDGPGLGRSLPEQLLLAGHQHIGTFESANWQLEVLPKAHGLHWGLSTIGRPCILRLFQQLQSSSQSPADWKIGNVSSLQSQAEQIMRATASKPLLWCWHHVLQGMGALTSSSKWC